MKDSSRKICGWLLCGGIVAVMNERRAYAINHIRKVRLYCIMATSLIKSDIVPSLCF